MEKHDYIGAVTSTTIPAPAPPWKTCLDIEAQDADHYRGNVNLALLDLVEGAPRRVLDLGCAAGHLGQKLKERDGEVSVVGIDANRAAATAAESRLDRVICARLDDLDFAAHGLRHGEFDAIVAADILEHLVNPWALLERLRPLLAPDGQLLVCVPNVRNLGVVSDLLQGGRWAYQDQGLLDITHLRFFTLHEMRSMFDETGYRAEKFGALISRALNETYQRHREDPSGTIQVGRMTLTGISPAELMELCAEEFLFRCRAAPQPRTR